jgi:hypothetical protein
LRRFGKFFRLAQKTASCCAAKGLRRCGGKVSLGFRNFPATAQTLGVSGLAEDFRFLESVDLTQGVVALDVVNLRRKFLGCGQNAIYVR